MSRYSTTGRRRGSAGQPTCSAEDVLIRFALPIGWSELLKRAAKEVAGRELNAEIEHASPYGKAPGEKVPGQKKTIGLAAALLRRVQAKGLID